MNERGAARFFTSMAALRVFHCNRCQFEHAPTARERAAPQPPHCVNCGDLVRPSVVWFGEVLPNRILDRAWREAERCDLMLVVGTSGVVYPAAQLPFVARQAGGRVIDVNPEETPIGKSPTSLYPAPAVCFCRTSSSRCAGCRARQTDSSGYFSSVPGCQSSVPSSNVVASVSSAAASRIGRGPVPD